MINDINGVISEIRNIIPKVNLDRPKYVQPEDSFKYRACRILLIIGSLDKKHGLSKEIISCMDFLLRNPEYQKKFLIEYYNEYPEKAVKFVKALSEAKYHETDLHVVKYKNIPWDLRFNDIFYFLFCRKLIRFIGAEGKRAKITEDGINYFEILKDIFEDEFSFLSSFGKRISEEKVKLIISETIPDVFWRENEKLINQ